MTAYFRFHDASEFKPLVKLLFLAKKDVTPVTVLDCVGVGCRGHALDKCWTAYRRYSETSLYTCGGTCG